MKVTGKEVKCKAMDFKHFQIQKFLKVNLLTANLKERANFCTVMELCNKVNTKKEFILVRVNHQLEIYLGNRSLIRYKN